jgi:hypothetical protein
MNKQQFHAVISGMKRFALIERPCGQSAFWLRLWVWASRRHPA